jgi:hypothetical protein
MNLAVRLLLIALAVLCMGNSCTKTPPPPAQECVAGTQIQFLDRVQFVEIDPGLTATVIDDYPAESETYGEAKRDADRRARLLATCNAKLFQIRTIEGTAR